MKNRVKMISTSGLILAILVMLLTGCAGNDTAGQKAGGTDSGKLSVAATLFPYYDFVRQVAGDRVDLKLVVPAGMDSHSFEPTPADMLTIQNADVIISNGGALEHWLSQVLEAIDTSDMTIMVGMDYVDTVQEEIVEGMEDEEHDHDHAGESHGVKETHDAAVTGGKEEPHAGELSPYDGTDGLNTADDGQGVEIEYDEHIWTSPVNAMTLVAEIASVLSDADPENADYYEANKEAYLEKLAHLDGEFREVVSKEKRNLIVVGDKFPFRYLADEYGLAYRAAFSGCSTDTEPSAKTIAYLIDKIRAEKIPVVYYLELSSHRVSEIISEETGAEPLLLHSCHNVTRRQFDEGVTYLELMEQNVINLRKGLDE